MPLYEYACADCGRRFERLVKSFRDEVSCPACASTGVEKLMSTFAMAGGGAGREPAPRGGGGGGGCCGGGCGCAR